MKNIWIFYQDGGTPKQGWGDRHFFLAKEYIKKGYKVTIFAGNNCHRYNSPVTFKGQFLHENIEGVHYCWVKIPAYSDSISFTRILSWLLFAFKLLFVSKKKVEKPDIIIVSSIPIFPILPGILYKWIYKAKLIFEIRDIWPMTVIQVGNFSPYNPFILVLKAIELIGYSQSHHIVSVLQHADKHIQNSISKKFSFTWISNGFSDEFLQGKEKDNSEHEILKKLPAKFLVGYTGTLGISNANEFLVDAARKLMSNENIHFVLVGDGPEKENLLHRAKGLTNITFIPKIPKNLVRTVLQHFSVGYLGWKDLDIYQYGISANKTFDYMSAGLPIIMSYRHNNNVLSIANCGYTVEPESGDAVAKAVLELYAATPEERRLIGENGRRFAQENFSYNSLARKFINIFNS